MRFLKYILVIAVFFTIFSFAYSDEGTISIHCPSMPVVKHRVGLWQAQKILSPVIITLPDNEVLKFDSIIEATWVHGVIRRGVDPCTLNGTADDGSVLLLLLEH